MMRPRPTKHHRRTRARGQLAAIGVCVALLSAFSWLGADRAAAQDWWTSVPGFEPFGGKRTLSVEERRSQNQRARDALAQRVGPEFQAEQQLLSNQTLRALDTAIGRYGAIVAAGGWQPIPDKTTLRKNDTGEAVSRVRRHLMSTGDLPAEAGAGWGFDMTLETAVARYQMRHGLRVTGFVDRRTRLALNVPARERLAQLRNNLARVRKLMKLAKSERVVIVNVPAYRLEALERGSLALRSNVVVGKPDRKTPEVSARIIEVNFYPYWRVPDSIARRDLIPQIRKNPSYFSDERFAVMKTWGAKPLDPTRVNWSSPSVRNYKFRQDPGSFNALGVVRINMPNKHTVYMHDTPLKQLFGQSARAFSSGCVRVERIIDLASWLLGSEPGWSGAKIQSVLGQQQRETAKLKKSVPVHFIYVTAWASGDGTAHFRQDIYSRDGLLSVAGNDLDDDAPQLSGITP
jgi:murein L,D-transpeptidase YcbB/YkuD